MQKLKSFSPQLMWASGALFVLNNVIQFVLVWWFLGSSEANNLKDFEVILQILKIVFYVSIVGFAVGLIVTLMSEKKK